MLYGIVIKEGKTESAVGKPPHTILRDENCVVIYDDNSRKIYLWVGQNSDIKSRFLASRLATIIRNREFGGAGRVIQNPDEIRSELAGPRVISHDIPRKYLASIK